MVSGTHRTWSVGPVGRGQWDPYDVVSGTSRSLSIWLLLFLEIVW